MTTTAPPPVNQPEFFRRMDLPLPTFEIDVPMIPTDPNELEALRYRLRQRLDLEERAPNDLAIEAAQRYYRQLTDDEIDAWMQTFFKSFTFKRTVAETTDDDGELKWRTYENRWVTAEEEYPDIFADLSVMLELDLVNQMDAFDAVEIWVAGPGDYAAVGMIFKGEPRGTADGHIFPIVRWGNRRTSETEIMASYQEMVRQGTVYGSHFEGQTINQAGRLGPLGIVVALAIAALVIFILWLSIVH